MDVSVGILLKDGFLQAWYSLNWNDTEQPNISWEKPHGFSQLMFFKVLRPV